MDDYKLALKWAPVNYQYIDLNEKCNYYSIKRDLLCQVNFPSNAAQYSVWNTEKVRDRLEQANIAHLTPTAYYSVAETVNHFFILYSFYHADDSTHPNDMEGCLVILEKQTDDEQLLLGMITIAHYDFWYYTYKNRLSVKDGITTSGEFEIDEEFDGYGHPLIQQEEGKHGLYALGTHIAWFTKLERWFLSVINSMPDIIVYYPNDRPSEYSLQNLTKGKKMPYDPAFYYELVDILDEEKGFWKRWLNKPNETFGKDGKFYGGSANPPWQWKPKFEIKKDTELKLELIWTDPQRLASENFKPSEGGKEFNSRYIRHMDGTK